MELELWRDPPLPSVPPAPPGTSGKMKSKFLSNYHLDFKIHPTRQQSLAVGQKYQVLVQVLGTPGKSLSSQMFLPVKGGA